jgi:hypothetical protein
MAARRYRSRLGSFIHRPFFYALVPPSASICLVARCAQARVCDDKYL